MHCKLNQKLSLKFVKFLNNYNNKDKQSYFEFNNFIIESLWLSNSRQSQINGSWLCFPPIASTTKMTTPPTYFTTGDVGSRYIAISFYILLVTKIKVTFQICLLWSQSYFTMNIGALLFKIIRIKRILS